MSPAGLGRSHILATAGSAASPTASSKDKKKRLGRCTRPDPCGSKKQIPLGLLLSKPNTIMRCKERERERDIQEVVDPLRGL